MQKLIKQQNRKARFNRIMTKLSQPFFSDIQGIIFLIVMALLSVLCLAIATL